MKVLLCTKIDTLHQGFTRICIPPDSVDYDVVLEGEITLELDDGAQVLLRKHDVAVQHGNRHAWRNLSDRPATMLFVLVGAKRPPITGGCWHKGWP